MIGVFGKPRIRKAEKLSGKLIKQKAHARPREDLTNLVLSILSVLFAKAQIKDASSARMM